MQPMRLDLYQAETDRLANEQAAMLDEARHKLQSCHTLTALEQAGILHALQILIENSIGKAKHLLKATGEPVPVSAYDAFASLIRIGKFSAEEVQRWNSAIGIRKRIVHDYMNLNMELILNLVKTERYQFIVEFLRAPIEIKMSNDD
jgi:uncharacterized protein YutE (UPF0331/DUF86 family)